MKAFFGWSLILSAFWPLVFDQPPTEDFRLASGWQLSQSPWVDQRHVVEVATIENEEAWEQSDLVFFPQILPPVRSVLSSLYKYGNSTVFYEFWKRLSSPRAPPSLLS